MKHLPRALTLLTLLDWQLSTSQEVTSSDPLMNRLFLMPTGQTMAKSKFSFTIIDAAMFQAGYAPTEFLQANATWLIPFVQLEGHKGYETNWSLGAKVRIFEGDGFIRGLALGSDLTHVTHQRVPPPEMFDYGSISFGENEFDEVFDIFPPRSSPWVFSTNIAASFGGTSLSGHLNVGQLFYSSPDNNFGQSVAPRRTPTYFQVGVEYDFGVLSTGLGVKAITELFYSNGSRVVGQAMISGMRFYRKAFVFEFAWPFMDENHFHLMSQIPLVTINLLF